MIYLDNAATTSVSRNVLNRMEPYFTDVYGNANSLHVYGKEAGNAICIARREVSLPIGAGEDNIVFTSGGSEANSLAITGLSRNLMRAGKKHIITSSFEHHSVLNSMKFMESIGFDVTYVSPDENGIVDPDCIKRAMRKDTGLVSVMFVNNELGTKQDISSIGYACRENDIIFHTDCVQAYGHYHINVDDFYIDMMSVSGHKFHAPKGIGFLYVRNKSILSPIIFGGEQEFGIRGGTENTPYIVGIGMAASDAYADIDENNDKYRVISSVIRNGLSSCLPESHYNGNAPEDSKIISVTIQNVDAQSLVIMLSNCGVAVSAGSACSSHTTVPSHVLKSIGMSDEDARSTIRISVSDMTTFSEAENAVQRIYECASILRSVPCE